MFLGAICYATNFGGPGALTVNINIDTVTTTSGFFTNLTCVTGTATEMTIGDITAMTLGADVIASSVAINTIYPLMATTGLYSRIQVSSVAVGAVNITQLATDCIDSTKVKATTLDADVIVSSVGINTVYPLTVTQGLYSRIQVSSVAMGTNLTGGITTPTVLVIPSFVLGTDTPTVVSQMAREATTYKLYVASGTTDWNQWVGQ